MECKAGDEYVVFRNGSGQVLDLAGFEIQDEGPKLTHAFEAGFQFGPGESWTLVSGPNAAVTGPNQLNRLYTPYLEQR